MELSALRRQCEAAWTQMGRLARLTAYLAGVDAVLFLLWRASLLGRGGSGLAGWVRFLSFVVGLLLAFLAARWLRRKLMWRLRNRLIVTYIFIGVIPVVLLAAIALIGAYLFAWQFATYIATSDIRTEVSTLGALNTRAAADLAGQIAKGAAPSDSLLQAERGHESPYAEREITAWYRGKAASLGPQAGLPASGDKQMRSLVLDGGRVQLRAVDTVAAGSSDLVLISSVPLSEKLLEKMDSELGEISITMFSSAPDVQRPRNGKRLVIGNETLDLGSEKAPTADTPATIRAGKLPPPANRFDRVISAGSLVPVVEWKSGKSRNALLAVLTRPSLLYARLFRTVGPSVSFILAVLVAVAVFFALIELFALVVGVRLTRTMTRSVAALYRATQRVNRGDFSHRIEVRSEDQLAALESSFNSMTASLEKLIAEQKEKQRLENELAIAQEVQAQLFPRHSTELPALELYGVCRPARTVSGDYYDFLPLESDKVALAVGDVSGKGISAALLMATIHSAVRAFSLEAAVRPALSAALAGASGGGYRGGSLAFANGDLSPARLMSLLNRQLYRSTPSEKYATLFFSTYNGRSRTLTYCNAGHLAPVIVRPDGSTRKLDCGGTVVGLFDEVPYEEGEVQLAAGDIFVAYSDGITEPENDFGEFGEARLLEFVRENMHLPLERISELVISAVTDWIGGAEQPDDMTLVLARSRQ